MALLGIDIGGSSVKAAHIGEGVIETATSSRYSDPDRTELTRAIRECVDALDAGVTQCIGLCMPGRVNSEGTAIETAVNLPALNNWMFDDLLASVFPNSTPASRVVSDADAAGYDFATEFPITGRTAAISLGTGVGLCVLDGEQIATIGGRGIGHIGHMDVGRFGSNDRVDSAGTRNTLESYIGARSLQPYAEGLGLNLAPLTQGDPPIEALVQAIKIVHAIYQPNRIALLGGVGLALKQHKGMIAEMVNDGLTPLADKNWVIEFASSSFCAACGAAKLASQSL